MTKMETDFDALYEFHAVAQTMEDEFSQGSDLQRLFTRRRSISLTSEIDPEMLSAVVARVRRKHEANMEHENDDTVKRRHPPRRNTSDPKRPSSMLVHDNEELLQLADELHLRDMHSKEWRPVILAGRRSSTHAGYLLYQGVPPGNCTSDPDKSKNPDSLRRASVCSNQLHPADGVPLKLSPTSGSKSTGSKLSSLSHLFGTGGKRSNGSNANPPSGNIGGVQGKIAKKMERQLSKDNSGDNRRAQFLQARSNTGLNFFGGRRRSIAVTDDAYGVALRSAKSHLDLSGPQLDQHDQQHEHPDANPKNSQPRKLFMHLEQQLELSIFKL